MGKTDKRTEPTTNTIITKILPKRNRLKCKNKSQKDFANLITEKEIVFASGPAGVGKSYVAIARAIELLQNKTNRYDKIIISRPAVEAEEKYGFLPGDVKEKLQPYMAPSIDIVDKIITKVKREQLELNELLVVEPLGFIRGKTIDNAILIMEEAQNMSPRQMKTLLTRIGENSKYIISGDLDQSDRYRDINHSGLSDAFIKHKNVSEVGFFEFSVNDIVRNPLISKILSNYKIIDQQLDGKSPTNINTDDSDVIVKPSLLKRIFSSFKW
jgi:phosphate starvation-inducible PhoH-like protein